MNRRPARLVWMVAVGLVLFSADAWSGDREAAERQYRIARRLAAEGSPQATEALRRVVELDPDGPLADDALMDEALLEPLPRWPEGLGRLQGGAALRAAALLDRVLSEHEQGDRAHEARYYRGLLQLEPLQFHDPAAARLDLLALATSPDAAQWGHAARYLVAWLAERQGERSAAWSAYQRLIIEAPQGPTVSRAMLGLARLDLAEGRPGRAAAGIQSIPPGEAASLPGLRALRDLAVRTLTRGSGGARAPVVARVVAATGVRAPVGFAVAPDGGLVLADRREGLVISFDPLGRERARWEVEEPQAVAVNELGRVAVASGERMLRLEPERTPLGAGSLGSFAPVSALAMDALGGTWLLDRRGERIGRIDPGASEPRTVWETSGARLGAMIWDGRRLVVVDGRERKIMAIEPDGSERTLIEELRRPVAVGSDPSGRVAVLDAREGLVIFIASDGGRGPGIRTAGLEIEKPLAVDLGTDGSLHLFDGATGSWVRVP